MTIIRPSPPPSSTQAHPLSLTPITLTIRHILNLTVTLLLTFPPTHLPPTRPVPLLQLLLPSPLLLLLSLLLLLLFPLMDLHFCMVIYQRFAHTQIQFTLNIFIVFIYFVIRVPMLQNLIVLVILRYLEMSGKGRVRQRERERGLFLFFFFFISFRVKEGESMVIMGPPGYFSSPLPPLSLFSSFPHIPPLISVFF